MGWEKKGFKQIQATEGAAFDGIFGILKTKQI